MLQSKKSHMKRMTEQIALNVRQMTLFSNYNGKLKKIKITHRCVFIYIVQHQKRGEQPSLLECTLHLIIDSVCVYQADKHFPVLI